MKPTESRLVRGLLIAAALGALGVMVVLPLVVVFHAALADGWRGYWAALAEPETRSALRLTLLVAGIAVPFNTVVGVAAAWLLAGPPFRGRSVLATLIDAPFSVSPVVAGLVFVLLFGRHGIFGPWLSAHDLKIIFALPGLVMATTFVTFPLVTREVLAVLEAHGLEEEEAALTLGAGGARIFFQVTLPKIKWGLIYGVILCNARAMGEFGAVSVVSGHILGATNTLPLQVENLYNEYNFTGAFAAATLLTVLALVTLVVKRLVKE